MLFRQYYNITQLSFSAKYRTFIWWISSRERQGRLLSRAQLVQLEDLACYVRYLDYELFAVCFMTRLAFQNMRCNRPDTSSRTGCHSICCVYLQFHYYVQCLFQLNICFCGNKATSGKLTFPSASFVGNWCTSIKIPIESAFVKINYT